MNDILHILSLNCQGLRDKMKRKRLQQYLLQQKTDIVLLQETHFTHEIAETIRQEFIEWKVLHSYGGSNNKGCSIFIRNSVNHVLLSQYNDQNGRYNLINIEIKNNTYTLLNIYAFNNKKDRHTYFSEITNLINDCSEGIVIMGGDFNEVLSETDRISRSRDKNIKISKSLEELIRNQKLVDIWRLNNPEKNHFTWRRKNNIEKSRIDFWLIDENITPLVYSTDIRPAIIQYTDHLAISLKLKSPVKRGPGFWKLNNAH